jgi:hypothetical protein
VYVTLRLLIRWLVQAPTVVFVGAWLLSFGVLRAAWGLAGMRGWLGTMTAVGVLHFLCALVLLLTTVRRRQSDSLMAATHLLVITLGGQALSFVLTLPLVSRLPPPPGMPGMSLAGMFFAGLGIQAVLGALLVPVVALVIWLTRRVTGLSAPASGANI